ncbi:hypothetical protein Tco_1147951, partial [Tanacetum coccineum]
TEQITPNLICPSTHQLLWSSGGDSGPDMSFDKSASLERLLSLARRHSYSCVSNELPADGYDRNDVERLRVHLIRLREMRDEGDAKIVEEPHHLSVPLLEHGRSASATASEPSQPSKKRRLKKRASKASSSAPELGQAKGLNEADITDFCAELEDSMKRDEGPPPSMDVSSVSGRPLVGTSAHASTSGRSLALGGSVVGGFAGKAKAEAMRRQMDQLDALARSALSRDAEYDEIPKDEFGTATRGLEIELTLFPLAPGLYHMSYPYEGVSSPLYTKKEKALDRTITPAELRRTESLLPLELSNRVNILSALLVSHGMELNSRYTDLVASRVHLQEKLDRKTGYVKENRELRSQRDVASKEVTKLQSQLADARVASVGLTEELAQIDAKLSEQVLIVRDLQNELALERLLLSDEFHVALAHVASLGINYGVEKGLRMGRTDADFEAASWKLSNFHIGVEADFNKALVAFPTTPFPFLSKVVAAAEGTLSEVTKIFLDKLARSTTSVAIAPPIVNEARTSAIDHASMTQF